MVQAANFDEIHAEFRGRIHRYLRHLAGESEADDLTQAVFLKVSAALPGFRGESSLSTWIYRIATNVARDHARSQGRWQSVDTEAHGELPDPALETADRAYIREEMRACVREQVDQLPEQYRAVLLLSDFEDLPNAQISEVLVLSLDTVKIRLHRARARLRAILECKCTFYRDDENEVMCDRKLER